MRVSEGNTWKDARPRKTRTETNPVLQTAARRCLRILGHHERAFDGSTAPSRDVSGTSSGRFAPSSSSSSLSLAHSREQRWHPVTRDTLGPPGMLTMGVCIYVCVQEVTPNGVVTFVGDEFREKCFLSRRLKARAKALMLALSQLPHGWVRCAQVSVGLGDSSRP